MQEKYISLDPAVADNMAYQQRKQALAERRNEAIGGELSGYFGWQVAVTFTAIHYANLRSKGFTFTPIQVNKYNRYASLAFTGCAGMLLGCSIVKGIFGDHKQS